MAKQKLRAGELGTIQVVTLPSGRFQARARLCDEVGKLHQLKASGTTAALAETALREKADAVLNDSGGPTLGKDATIKEAAFVFLYDKGRSGTVEDSTMEAYEASVRNVITPTCGDLLLRDFTVRRCNRILADIREQRSLAAARKARSVLSLICQPGSSTTSSLSTPCGTHGGCRCRRRRPQHSPRSSFCWCSDSSVPGGKTQDMGRAQM